MIVEMAVSNKEVEMMLFQLRGLAEGMVGASEVRADSVEDLFVRHPALAQVRDKLVVNGNTVSGFAACDG